MKTIGIIGGMSWESSAQYYAIINRAVRDRLGSPHSARILMHSLDFAPIAQMQADGEWEQLGEAMAGSARALEAGGADCLLIATNTMHKLADEVEEACDLPLIHIADSTADAVCEKGLTRVALLGTAFTMEQDFYRDRLEEHHGLDVIIPDNDDRAEVHRIIYEELIAGEVRDTSREAYREIIERLVDQGAQGVILGCTEIMLLISQSDSPVPIFDTTELHALAAVEFALS
ncbi:aspartate/glutamate racemase [Erythrobacter sp. KY5]|uniref:aspartate/glutamate racemase family protein n=1 Tax=Erythrobacter sp. KY5 TaxID=2011159 RepID=UPI000DBF1BAD|nr:aspartate/glutamate racemase family protein [Erythrobacter sp. KY5]AWW73868.1 aspartate/glutamate racemase [Erythrobacter sp. KY5]